MERIGEVTIVVMVGGMLLPRYLPDASIWFLPVLFLLIRPIPVWLGLLGSPASTSQRRLIAWFGIRGIGSMMYAINHGLPQDISQMLTALALSAVAMSIVVHSISVTPIMKLYRKRFAR